MAQETVTAENVETGKASKKVDLASRIPEVVRIGDYVTSGEASRILSQHAGKNIPVTTVNNLAYAGKIEAVKASGVFWFKEHGEKSVDAYLPTMTEKSQASEQRKQEKERKATSKELTKMFKKEVDAKLANGEIPDFDKIRKELEKKLNIS